MSTLIREVTDATFNEEVLQTEETVIVKIWASWCGPCKALAPTIDELAVEFEKRVKFVSLDADSNMSTLRTYGIKSVPVLLFFRNGELKNQVVGFVAKDAISRVIYSVGFNPPKQD